VKGTIYHLYVYRPIKLARGLSLMPVVRNYLKGNGKTLTKIISFFEKNCLSKLSVLQRPKLSSKIKKIVSKNRNVLRIDKLQISKQSDCKEFDF
jgi:hypothetical protein